MGKYTDLVNEILFLEMMYYIVLYFLEMMYLL